MIDKKHREGFASQRVWIKKSIFFILLLIVNSLSSYSQVTVCSWNLKDLGRTKNDSEIEFIANTVNQFDVVLIQEVVAKDPAGAKAVARLTAALNRKGSKWDYTISNPTSGNSYKSERYAFIWKTSKLKKVGKAWLEKKYSLEIDREPYFATFKTKDQEFTLVNFHAITKARQPETEIKYFKYLPKEYPDKNLIFCGDFNCPESHTVFNPLKSMGYKPIFIRQKTSLKMRCTNSTCLSSEFDNIFYNSKKVKKLAAGVIHFYKDLYSFEEARLVSDHIPIYFKFTLY